MITDLQINSYIAVHGSAAIAGYPLALVVDGDYTCPTCAERDSFTERQLQHASLDVYFEGPDLTCDCGAILEPAYYTDPELEEALAGPWIPE